MLQRDVLVIGEIITNNSILKQTDTKKRRKRLTVNEKEGEKLTFNDTVNIAKIVEDDRTEVKFFSVKCLKEDDNVYTKVAGPRELQITKAEEEGKKCDNMMKCDTMINTMEKMKECKIYVRPKNDFFSEPTEIMARKTRQVTCEVCRAKFKDEKTLRAHMNSMSPSHALPEKSDDNKEEIQDPGRMEEFLPGVFSTQKEPGLSESGEEGKAVSETMAMAMEDLDETHFEIEEQNQDLEGDDTRNLRNRIESVVGLLREDGEDGLDDEDEDDDEGDDPEQGDDPDETLFENSVEEEEAEDDGQESMTLEEMSPNLLERERGRARMEEERKMRDEKKAKEEKMRKEKELIERQEREKIKRQEALNKRAEKEKEKQIAAKEERIRKERERKERLRKVEEIRAKGKLTGGKVIASKLNTTKKMGRSAANVSTGETKMRKGSVEESSGDKKRKIVMPAPRFVDVSKGSSAREPSTSTAGSRRAAVAATPTPTNTPRRGPPSISATYAHNMINKDQKRYDVETPKVVIPKQTGQDAAFAKALAKMEKEDKERIKKAREVAREEQKNPVGKGGAVRGLNNSRRKTTTPVVAKGRITKAQKTPNTPKLPRAASTAATAVQSGSGRMAAAAAAVTAAVAALGNLGPGTDSPRLKAKRGRPRKMTTVNQVSAEYQQQLGDSVLQEQGSALSGQELGLGQGSQAASYQEDEASLTGGTETTVAERSEMETEEEDHLIQNLETIENEAMANKEKLEKMEKLAASLQANNNDLTYRLDKAQGELEEVCLERRDLRQKLNAKEELFRRVFPNVPLEMQDNFLGQIDEKVRQLNFEIQHLTKALAEKDELNKQLLTNNAETNQQLVNMRDDRDSQARRAAALEKCIPCEVRGCNASICPRNHEVTTRGTGKKRVTPCQWFWASFDGCTKEDCTFSHTKPTGDEVLLKEYNHEIEKLKVVMAKMVVKKGLRSGEKSRSGEKKGARARSSSRGRSDKKEAIEVVDSPAAPPQASLRNDVLPPAPFPQQVSTVEGETNEKGIKIGKKGRRRRKAKKRVKMKQIVTLPIKIINTPSQRNTPTYASAVTGGMSNSPSAKRKRQEDGSVNNGLNGTGAAAGSVSCNIDWMKVMFNGILGESILAGMIGNYQGNANGVSAMEAAGPLSSMSTTAKMRAMGKEFASDGYQRDLALMAPARSPQTSTPMASMEGGLGPFASQVAGTMNSFQLSQEKKMKEVQDQLAALTSALSGGINPMASMQAAPAVPQPGAQVMGHTQTPGRMASNAQMSGQAMGGNRMMPNQMLAPNGQLISGNAQMPGLGLGNSVQGHDVQGIQGINGLLQQYQAGGQGNVQQPPPQMMTPRGHNARQ